MPDQPFLQTLSESHRYRTLLLDIRGKVLRVRAISAGDDEEASCITRNMLDGRAIELWDKLRFIKRFGPVQA